MHTNSNAIYRKAVDLLYEKGIGSYVELPQIAVLGDTSTGKSSLLSTISGVQFPASEKLTTRCPTRLRMEKSKDNSVFATVGIHWDAHSEYKNDNFEEIHLTELSEIGGAISRAQQHIIASSRKEVASDIVEVSVKSPTCVDVTLIDLPGIARTTGNNESKSMIDEIRELLNAYLRNTRCVLLIVIPANVDFHNCESLENARKVDPETRRTIPVITKPDLVDPGAEQGIVDLFEGRMIKDFLYGFHIVKCRGQAALNDGKTIAEGLRAEELFFSNHASLD